MKKTVLAFSLAALLPSSSAAQAPSAHSLFGPDAICLFGFRLSPDADSPLLKKLRQEVLFAVGLRDGFDEALDGLGGIPDGTRSALVGMALGRDGEQQTIVVLEGELAGNAASRPSETGSPLAAHLLDTRLLMVAPPERLKRSLKEAGAPALADTLLERLLATENRSLWGVASSRWLQLDGQDPPPSFPGSFLAGRASIAAIFFEADVDSDIDFRMTTLTETVKSAHVLADELKVFLPNAASGNAPEEVRRIVQDAQVSLDGRAIELKMKISAPAIETLQESQTAANLFRWKLPVGSRETTQRVAEIFELLGVAEGRRIADIGAGRGFFSVRLARAVGPAGRVLAVDIRENSLAWVRRRAENNSLSQIETILGEPDNPKLGNESLDGALIVNSYHEMEEHPSMLEHIRRALRPGGCLLITEPISAEREPMTREEQIESHEIAPRYVEQELKEAGFEIRERHDEFIWTPENERHEFVIVGCRKG